ncbi:hypothetical protein J6590_081978 [Homalodisca vitripennis]|nr:hypothetical protein J6590_081978 [Homalodisca vitripennis]
MTLTRKCQKYLLYRGVSSEKRRRGGEGREEEGNGMKTFLTDSATQKDNRIRAKESAAELLFLSELYPIMSNHFPLILYLWIAPLRGITSENKSQQNSGSSRFILLFNEFLVIATLILSNTQPDHKHATITATCPPTDRPATHL